MEQVFFIADFHLGDHDVFTKDENGRRMNVNVAVRDNWLLDMWMSQVGKKDCVYILSFRRGNVDLGYSYLTPIRRDRRRKNHADDDQYQ